MVFKIPYNNCIYYHNNELLFTKSTFAFIIIFLLQYLDNNYLNIFKYDNNILFIIDYSYTVELINNLGINKIDKKHADLSLINFKNYRKSIKNKQHSNKSISVYGQNTKRTNEKYNKDIIELSELETSLNTYTLCWIKYMKNRFTFIFILYLCYFSKYKHYSNTIIIEKINRKLAQNIKYIITSCNHFNNKGISDIVEISDKHLCINFKYINHIIMDNQYILKYLNKNIIMYNNFNYQINVILRNILSYYEKKYEAHINNNKDIIKKSGFFSKLGIVPYINDMSEDTFF
jgi:hypothetical protein